MCNKLNQQAVNGKYGTLKNLKLWFCCPNLYLMKGCKSERFCGVNGCTEKHNRLLHSVAQEIDKDTKKRKQKTRPLKTRPAALLRCRQETTVSYSWFLFREVMKNNVLKPLRSVLLDPLSLMDQTSVELPKLKGKESVMFVAGILGSSDLISQMVSAKVGSSEAEIVGDNLLFCSHPNLNGGEKRLWPQKIEWRVQLPIWTAQQKSLYDWC